MPNESPGDDEAKPAPEPLILIQALVNTVERPDGRDRLADPADARAWLVAHQLLTPAAQLTSADLDLALDVRESLRALLVHNAGGQRPDASVLAPLRDVAAVGNVRAELDPDGGVRLETTGDSIRQRLARLLLIIRDAQRDGSWSRLKACANAECQWAFYDRSRNHGGTWCEMATCGNKLKNRDLRARRRQAAAMRPNC